MGRISALTFILLIAPVLGAHPRLLLDSSEIPNLREQAASTHMEIWDAVKYYADQRLGQACPLPNNYGLAANAPFTLSFAYIISGESKYLIKAKECLLINADQSKWPYWDSAGTRDLYLADMLLKNSLAYDWLYSNMSEQERGLVRASLARHAQEMYEASDYDNKAFTTWWDRSFIQNHRTTNNAGLGMAALAIEGEEGYRPEWLQHVNNEFMIDKFIMEQIADGTWHEGYNYANGKHVSTLPYFVAIEELKGINLFAEEYMHNYIRWRAYNYLPAEYPAFPVQSVVPDWGWNAGMHQMPLRYLAARYDDGVGEWLAREILKVSTRERYRSSHAPNMVFEFLFYDASVQPKAPDYAYDSYFPDAGIVVWRTGWGEDDIVFGLKSGKFGGKWASDAFFSKSYPFDMESAGANVGHNHADSNTFYLFKGASDLSSEKPHRQTYDQPTTWSTTSLHNTIVVDGKNQFMFHKQGLQGQDVGGEIEKVLVGKNANYLRADATDAYRTTVNWAPGELIIDRFERHVVYLKPGIFVILDDLRAGSMHAYDFMAHVGGLGAASANHITQEGDWVKGTVGDDVLGIRMLAPSGYAFSKGISSIPDSNQKMNKAYAKFSKNADDTRFIAVLYPTDASGWTGRPAVQLLGDSPGCAGIRAGNDIVLLGYGTCSDPAFGIDGEAAIIRESSMLIINASYAAAEGTSYFESAGRQTLEALWSGTRLDITGDVQDFIINVPGISQVYVNGIAADADIAGSSVTIGKVCQSTSGLMESVNLWKSGSLSMAVLMNRIRSWKACS